MEKIRTKNKINWGGYDPLFLNHVEIRMEKLYETVDSVLFNIKDVVIGEKKNLDANNIEIVSEYDYQIIRDKNVFIPITKYNELYLAIDSQLSSTLTPFEKEKIRPKLALLYYFTNDTISNGKCGYNTNSTNWKIV
jgi:hypothetical protein